MAYLYPFPSQLPSSSFDLPACLISLEDWALVTVTGTDGRKYLQGQLTCDVDALSAEAHSLAAHCESKGKMWSSLRLFAQGEDLAYIERSSVCDKQLAELKKYAVFSKITLTRSNDSILLGLAGRDCRQHLAKLYSQLPDSNQQVVHHEGTTLLHLQQPSERFIIVTHQAEAERIFNALLGSVALNDSHQWLALDIEAGIPVIDEVNSGQFLPQSANLQALGDAICFKKGCYSGQEMVARAKYRGANKRALYWLKGKSWRLPQVGEELELKLGENWRRTGTVLAAVALADEHIWVQAILNNDLEADSELRVKDELNSSLTIRALPYSLEEAPKS